MEQLKYNNLGQWALEKSHTTLHPAHAIQRALKEHGVKAKSDIQVWDRSSGHIDVDPSHAHKIKSVINHLRSTYPKWNFEHEERDGEHRVHADSTPHEREDD